MKVQHDTGWYSLINKALGKKPVDKLEGANQELSEYSSVSTLTNVWPMNRLWQRKNRLQKPQSRYHRLPPSLLSSKAADLWNTLSPLRANCSCSSVSVGIKCSRSSFGSSFSGVTLASSQSSVPSIRDTVVPQSLRNTLEHAHLAFELLIARMLRLMNILNAGSSSSSHLFSGSDLKVSPALNQDSKRSAEFIVGDSCYGFSTVTCLSTDSNDHSQERWLGERAGKKSQSSSKFEIAEQREKYSSSVKNFFPSKSFPPKGLRESNCVLTKEELSYLLQNKKSILSEYFQRKIESTNFKRSLDLSKRKPLIYGTQSDSRLQHRGLLEFVQFIRTRKKENSENVVKEDIHSSAETLESKTELEPLSKEISYHPLIHKRRVTFGDPVVENSTTLSSRCVFKNNDEISSSQSFVTANIYDADDPCFGFVNSKFALPLDSSITPKISTAIPSSGDLALESNVHDEEPKVVEFDDTQSEILTKNVSEEEVEMVSVIPEDDFDEPTISVLTNTLTFGLSKQEAVDMIGRKRSKRLKFLVGKILDFGTTHVPTLDEDELVDDAQEAALDQSFMQQNVERHFQRSTWQVLTPETSDPAGKTIFTLNHEVEDHPIGKKVNKLKTNPMSKIPIKTHRQSSTFSCSGEKQPSKIESNDHLPSLTGKTVTFQDICQTISDRSIISDHADLELSLSPDDELFPVSDTTGRFELAWKGCWEQQSTKDFEQSKDQVKINFEEEGRNFLELHAIRNQNSYYTMTEEQIELPDDYGVGNRNKGFEFRTSQNSPSFTTVPMFPDNSQTIPWITKPNEYLSEQRKQGSKFNYTGFEPSPEEINLRNFTDLQEGLGHFCKGIRNPEIWRTDVPALPQRNWFTACDCNNSLWKKPKIQNDCLIRKLDELHSSPDADYGSDYYMESDVESDFELKRNLSRIKGSFANINTDSENRTSLKMRKNRLGGNLFLDKVWSAKNIFVGGCQCHKNAWSPRHNLQLRERDLKYRSLRDSDQRYSQNFRSHLRARLIIDSETDDSDIQLAPSIQSDYTYNYKRRSEHVNKMKCRRFVRSMKNVGSSFEVTPRTADRLYSSSEVLDVAFERSFSPAGVQTVLSTRSIGTTISARQKSCSVMDVCTDTYDLSSNESIGTITLVSDLFLPNNDSDCQTLESFLVALKLLQSSDRVSQPAEVLDIKTDTQSGSSLTINESRDQKFSNAMANLSAEISDASNNLAKLRFADINAANKRDNLNGTRYVSCSQKLVPQSANVSETHESFKNGCKMLPLHDMPTKEETVEIFEEKQSVVPNDFNTNCPICSSQKKSTTRYAVPTCIVMGSGPDSRENEKDPWNRVMERAKVQRRFEGWNASTFSEVQKTSSTTKASSPNVYLNSFENKQSSTSIDRGTETKESAAEMRRVESKSNSSQSTCALQNSAAIYNKTPSFPIQNATSREPLFSSAALCSSNFSNFPALNLPRSRSSSRRNRKSLVNANMSNRLLYIITEKSELINQMPIKVPAANFFS